MAFTRARENLFIVLKSKESMFDILDLTPKKYGKLLCSRSANGTAIQPQSHHLEYKELCYGTQSDILRVDETQQEDIKAINFGLAMHYMLEMLGDFREEHIRDAKDMMMNKYGDALGDDEIEDIENRVKLLLQNEEFLSLSRGERYKEKALKYKNNLKYIDLLIKRESLWIVIDYKSSLTNSVEQLAQVALYVYAIKEITRQESEGYVCYLLNDKIKILKV